MSRSAVVIKLRGFFDINNDRSRNVFRNIFLSFGARGGSIVVSLLLVPMTIDYISPLEYGIWLTISSIVSWMNFFDIGLGNGLRNKLATALATGSYSDAKKYVSTTYFLLTIISCFLLILTFLIVPNVNWRSLLNIPTSVNEDINFVILIVLCSFCLQFVIQTINTVLTATHEPSKAAFLSFLGQLGILIAVFVMKKTMVGSLNTLVFALTLIPIVVFFIASIVIYKSKLSQFAPSIKSIDMRYAKSIMQVGGAFFFIQIGAMVLFQTDNIIISKVIGPGAVAEFNIAYKLFSIVTMASTIIITPYWSAFTDAYAKQDFKWMRKNIKTIRIIWACLSVGSVLLYLISSYVYKFWIGKAISVSSHLSLAMMIYVIFSMWQTIHVFFLNGIGKVRMQLFLVSISALFNIPLSIYLGKVYGLPGIISANTIVFIFMGLVFSIQTEKILNGKASGIWVK